MNDDLDDRAESLDDIAIFLSTVEAFKTLGRDQLAEVAAAVTHHEIRVGEAVIVEGGRPSTQLWVLRDGALDLLHRESLVTVMTAGQLLGYGSLLTRTAPAFTVRGRSDCRLYGIPGELGVRLLSREDGVRWLAETQREALLYAARSLSPLPDVQTLPVTSVVRDAPLVCEPETTISEAAELMSAEGRSAILVRARDGLGIVTDADLRDKVVVGRVSREAPVGAIMSAPVHTIGADALAAEAGITMLTFGVGHLPVLADDGTLAGIISARDLMTLEARNPFALRRSLQRSRDEDELVAAAADIPQLFVDLLDARLDTTTLSRLLTVLHDSLTVRLIELAIKRRGEPPVPYAWLAFGSAARYELTLTSDQDNGLAYADTDDPAADAYFRGMAEDVNRGLGRCGFEADTHGVLARSDEWRMSASAWVGVFRDCLEGADNCRLLRAAVAFDFRHVCGDLSIVPRLEEVMSETPQHPRFKAGLAELGAEIRSPLGFRGRMGGRVDIKNSGLLPIQNLARYYALAHGVTTQSTLERLAALCDVDVEGAQGHRLLRESYLDVKVLQLQHHAEAVRAGRRPDNTVDADTLRPLAHAKLREALRVVAAAQERLPRRPL